MATRILFISDLHSGHIVGITPPQHNTKVDGYEYQRDELWGGYIDMIKEVGPVDILIVNGDGVDGRGERAGSRDIIEIQQSKQMDWAEEAIDHIERKKTIIIEGTTYHTGLSTAWEEQLAIRIGATYSRRFFGSFDDVIFDVRHFIAGSVIPHGRATPAMREKLWNTLWAKEGVQPEANVVVRSHVHYPLYVGDDDYVAIITPGLQGLGGIYGEKMCSGVIKFGMLLVTCDRGKFSWRIITRKVASQRAKLYTWNSQKKTLTKEQYSPPRK